MQFRGLQQRAALGRGEIRQAALALAAGPGDAALPPGAVMLNGGEPIVGRSQAPRPAPHPHQWLVEEAHLAEEAGAERQHHVLVDVRLKRAKGLDDVAPNGERGARGKRIDAREPAARARAVRRMAHAARRASATALLHEGIVRVDGTYGVVRAEGCEDAARAAPLGYVVPVEGHEIAPGGQREDLVEMRALAA